MTLVTTYPDGAIAINDTRTELDVSGNAATVSIALNEERQEGHSWYDHLCGQSIDLDRDDVLVLAQALWDWLDATAAS